MPAQSQQSARQPVGLSVSRCRGRSLEAFNGAPVCPGRIVSHLWLRPDHMCGYQFQLPINVLTS